MWNLVSKETVKQTDDDILRGLYRTSALSWIGLEQSVPFRLKRSEFYDLFYTRPEDDSGRCTSRPEMDGGVWRRLLSAEWTRVRTCRYSCRPIKSINLRRLNHWSLICSVCSAIKPQVVWITFTAQQSSTFKADDTQARKSPKPIAKTPFVYVCNASKTSEKQNRQRTGFTSRNRQHKVATENRSTFLADITQRGLGTIGGRKSLWFADTLFWRLIENCAIWGN